MTQYIDKEKVEEILRNLWKEDDGNNSEHRIYYNKALQQVQCEIDTLETKEVDLEDDKKEELAQKYADYIFKRYNIDATSREGMLIYYAYMHGMNQCLI